MNPKATVMLPAGSNDLEKVKSKFEDARFEDGRIIFETGSGEYHIEI